MKGMEINLTFRLVIVIILAAVLVTLAYLISTGSLDIAKMIKSSLGVIIPVLS